MKLQGNTILITGGGSGIGQALAIRLNNLGNTVIVAGRRLEPLMETVRGRTNMFAMQLDIEKPGAVDEFARRVVAEHGSLNVLINNAGIMRFEALDQHRNLQDAEATVSTNFLGPIRLTNALIEQLQSHPNATIINVTSGLAFVPLVASPTYCATKAGIHSYTVSLREALKGKVEVIEIAPPEVKTDLTPGQQERNGQPLDEFLDEVLALLAVQPALSEIIVERASFARSAEARGNFDQVLSLINPVSA